jgi:hypothetical protein
MPAGPNRVEFWHNIGSNLFLRPPAVAGEVMRDKDIEREKQ